MFLKTVIPHRLNTLKVFLCVKEGENKKLSIQLTFVLKWFCPKSVAKEHFRRKMRVVCPGSIITLSGGEHSGVEIEKTLKRKQNKPFVFVCFCVFIYFKHIYWSLQSCGKTAILKQQARTVLSVCWNILSELFYPKKQRCHSLSRWKSQAPGNTDCNRAERFSLSFFQLHCVLQTKYWEEGREGGISFSKKLFHLYFVCSFINTFMLCCFLNSLLPLSPLQVLFCHCCFLVKQLAIGSSACISSFGTAFPYLQLTIKLSWLFNEEISLGISIKA